MTEHRLSDLYLAAYLVVTGYELLRVEPDADHPGSRRRFFVLGIPDEQSAMLEECRRSWWNGSATCNVKAYAQQLQTLKAAIYA